MWTQFLFHVTQLKCNYLECHSRGPGKNGRRRRSGGALSFSTARIGQDWFCADSKCRPQRSAPQNHGQPHQLQPGAARDSLPQILRETAVRVPVTLFLFDYSPPKPRGNIGATTRASPPAHAWPRLSTDTSRWAVLLEWEQKTPSALTASAPRETPSADPECWWLWLQGADEPCRATFVWGLNSSTRFREQLAPHLGALSFFSLWWHQVPEGTTTAGRYTEKGILHLTFMNHAVFQILWGYQT